MENKCIAIVANATWNIYKFRLNVIKKLLEKGNEVVVIAPLDEYISYKEKFPTVKHVSLKHLSRKPNPIKDLKLVLELRAIYKKTKPDLILHYTHKANIYGGFAIMFTRYKSIAVVTGLGYAFLRKGLVNTITRMMYKVVNRVHDKVLFENDDDMNLFVEMKLAAKNKVSFVNGCGVDTAVYLPIPAVENKTKTVFTFIGRLLYDKGIREFVEAAKIIKAKNSNTEFWIIGELDSGNPSMVDKVQLLEWIDEGNITYIGFLEDIRPHIAQSDCIVLPSYREGMPRTVLEGMSMAKSIITTDVAGCRQTVDDGKSGILVRPKDSLSLSKAMEQFLQMSHEQRLLMGEKGRQRAIEKFNSEKISNELYEIISQVYFCA